MKDLKRKPIKDFPGYEIDISGKVFSHKTKRYLKASLNYIGGYLRIELWNKNRPTSKTIHRLLAEAFIPVPIGIKKIEVNHKDGVKTNNAIFNLEWVTPSQNSIHSYKLGLSKLPDASKPIIQFTKNNHYISKYPSAADACRKTGIDSSAIRKVVTGRKKTAGGYIWKHDGKSGRCRHLVNGFTETGKKFVLDDDGFKLKE